MQYPAGITDSLRNTETAASQVLIRLGRSFVKIVLQLSVKDIGQLTDFEDDRRSLGKLGVVTTTMRWR
jgi:hypothetical protein